jgi:hypothetical protein
MGRNREKKQATASQHAERSDGIVVARISKNDVNTVLDRALKRERRYFRLTEGQRKSLRNKRAR